MLAHVPTGRRGALGTSRAAQVPPRTELIGGGCINRVLNVPFVTATKHDRRFHDSHRVDSEKLCGVSKHQYRHQ